MNAAFDTESTEELRIEAFMHDAMRKFQLTRKEIGLEIEDRITMTAFVLDVTTMEIVLKWVAVM